MDEQERERRRQINSRLLPKKLSLFVLFIVMMILVLSDHEVPSQPASPSPLDGVEPERESGRSAWVQPRYNHGTDWAKPGDPGYRSPEPDSPPATSSTPSGTSGVKPKPSAESSLIVRDGYLEAKHPNCSLIMARDMESLRAARSVCAGFDRGLFVGVMADGVLLNLWVGPSLATDLLVNEQTTREIVLNLMKAWKNLTDSPSVIVTIRWEDVELAKGDTTLRGDIVTIWE